MKLFGHERSSKEFDQIKELSEDGKYNYESIINDYIPIFTPIGVKRTIQIVTEYAQRNYDFQVPMDCSDLDLIFKSFLCLNDIDARIIHKLVHELTYNEIYCSKVKELDQQRLEAANAIRNMFPEYDVENMIESTFPGYGLIRKSNKNENE